MRQKLALIKYRTEAWLELALGKFLIVSIPFKYWSKLCGHSHCESLKTDPGKSLHRIVSVRRAITWASTRVPWKSVCFDKAVATQRMLSRRGLENTIYFGMIKDESQQWTAHSWVRCGTEWVVGYQENKNYTVVGTFAKFTRGERNIFALGASVNSFW